MAVGTARRRPPPGPKGSMPVHGCFYELGVLLHEPSGSCKGTSRGKGIEGQMRAILEVYCRGLDSRLFPYIGGPLKGILGLLYRNLELIWGRFRVGMIIWGLYGCFYTLEVLFVGVLVTRALPFFLGGSV